MDDYRRNLRDNLRRVFKAKGLSIKNPPDCYYLDGPRKGKRVAQRTIQYIWDWREGAGSPAPGLDVIAAIAGALDLQSWELLVPDLSPEDRPALSTERGLEAQVSRRVAERMQVLQGQLTALMRTNGTRGRSTAANDGTNNEVPSDGKGSVAD